MEREFKRLNFDSSYKLSHLNKDYSLCNTYPSKIILPSQVHSNTKLLEDSAQFRSSRRLPTVCWIHPQNNATISRCSQPKVGIRGVRSEADERVVCALSKKSMQSTENCTENIPGDIPENLCIIDCRPKLSAQANAYLKGAGFENTEHYNNCDIRFMNIDNIHVMRNSFKYLSELYFGPETPDRRSFEATKWLDYVRLIISGASEMARLVTKGKSLLVHCSDGWDRASQMVSLTELLLDPYYRTVKGFGILVQKEWLAFGHKFADRVGHGIDDKNSNEISPIFLQWVDAVYQVLLQFPNWFEFNESYLIDMIDAVHSGLFGTFLCNSERERNLFNVHENTLCFFRHVGRPSILKRYVNAQYIHSFDCLQPIESTSNLRVWIGFYQRYHLSMKQYHEHSIASLINRVMLNTYISENKRLKQKIQTLKNKIKSQSPEINLPSPKYSCIKYCADLNERVITEDYAPNQDSAQKSSDSNIHFPVFEDSGVSDSPSLNSDGKSSSDGDLNNHCCIDDGKNGGWYLIGFEDCPVNHQEPNSLVGSWNKVWRF